MQHPLLHILLLVGRAVCAEVQKQVKSQDTERLSAVFREDSADTIYQIDRDVEAVIVPILTQYADSVGGIALMAEGISEGCGPLADKDVLVLGTGFSASSARWRIIMDPIDGTRGIMYDKRSAWSLMGAAPNLGPHTTIADIEVAVMVELPTSRSWLADVLYAVRGQGAHLMTDNLFDGTTKAGKIGPSKATDLIGGFGQIARFFGPGRALLAHIEDSLIEALYPDASPGRALSFEDQYISTGGQMHQILTGKDRYVADIRKTLGDKLEADGKPRVFVCHPYDICCVLIAQEVGIEVTDGLGKPFDVVMDLDSPVDWIMYANPTLRSHIEPTLQSLISTHLR